MVKIEAASHTHQLIKMIPAHFCFKPKENLYKLRGSFVIFRFSRLLFLLTMSFLLLSRPIYALSREVAPAGDTNEESIKVWPLIPEQSVSTFLPSGSAPGRGLAINIIYPQKPRYKEGAPIVVVVPGGDTANGLNFCLHAAQIGCIEIRLAFPGGGTGNFKSSGINDYRGIRSQKALRDVLLFAAGKMQDFRNHTIADLVPVPLSKNNFGVVGWSNGGNVALITMEKYAHQLGFINWLVLYECPIGSLFFPPSLGSKDDFLLNNHYRQGSAATGHCLIDFRKLAWQADARQNPGLYKKMGEAELPGVVYFDDNQNGKWDESTEFAFNYCVDHGLRKKFYPPDITSALERLKVFANGAEPPAAAAAAPPPITPQATTQATVPAEPKKSIIDKITSKTTELRNKFKKSHVVPVKSTKTVAPVETIEEKNTKYWPATVATLAEAENYFQERDGSTSIPAICSLYPDLLITIFASQVDHLQTQPDHPHITLQYNAFLDNGAHWIRLNPETIYLAELTNMNKQNFAQSKPNAPIDAENIVDYLEPDGILSDYVFIDTTIAELTDRKHTNNLSSPLTTAIYHYANGLTAGGPSTKPANQQK